MNTVEKAEKQLQDFLEENPHLKKEQEKIDKILNKTPKDKRLEVMAIMLANSTIELNNSILKLSQTLVKLK